MYNCIIPCLICFFLAGAGTAERMPEPVSPDEPKIGSAADREKTALVPVTIVFAGGVTLDCSFLLPGEHLNVATASGGKGSFTKVPLREIKSIEFSVWRGEALDAQSFKFCPSSISIILKNEGRTVSCTKVPALHSFQVTIGKRTRKLFSCFYDYRAKGEWTNSREKDMKYPETHPLKDTVVKMLFRQEDAETSFMNFINIFRE